VNILLLSLEVVERTVKEKEGIGWLFDEVLEEKYWRIGCLRDIHTDI